MHVGLNFVSLYFDIHIQICCQHSKRQIETEPMQQPETAQAEELSALPQWITMPCHWRSRDYCFNPNIK